MADQDPIQDPIDELLRRTSAQGPLQGAPIGGGGPRRAPVLKPGDPRGPSEVPSWAMLASDLVAMVAGMAIPTSRPILGPLLRTGASVGGAGLTSKLLGGDPMSAMLRAGATQLPAEGMIGLGRGVVTQPIARRMLSERATQDALRAKTQAFNDAFADGLTSVEKQAYKDTLAAHASQYTADVATAKAEQQSATFAQRTQYRTDVQAAKTEHATATAAAEATYATDTARYTEQGAGHLAAAAKDAVPAWKGYSADTKGLLDMIYGTGQEKLSASFDTAMQAVVREGHGKVLTLSEKTAATLGFQPTKFIDAGEGIRLPVLDAGEVAAAAVGQWKKHPGEYREVVTALDKIGVGDPAARAEYKAGQAFIQFIDTTKTLEGEVFHPDRVLGGFTQLKKVDQLRKRGEGNIFQGPFSEAVRMPGAPTMPIVSPKREVSPPSPVPLRNVPQPETPPAPMPWIAPQVEAPGPLGLKTRPTYGHWGNRILGSAIGELVGQTAGHPGVGGLTGAALGTLVPQTLYGNVPLGPLGSGVTRLSPSAIAEILRLLQGSSS